MDNNTLVAPAIELAISLMNVCFNCDELGNEFRDCDNEVRCCICKSVEHVPRRCQYSWYEASQARRAPSASQPSRPDVNENEEIATNARMLLIVEPPLVKELL